MLTIMGIAVLGVLVLGLVRACAGGTSLASAVEQVEKTGDLKPVIAAVYAAPKYKESVKWDQAMELLWQNYARREAAELIMEAARRTDATVVQYWIRQVLEVEPAIAEEVFTQEFIDEHFEPEVAASCQKGGCCG